MSLIYDIRKSKQGKGVKRSDLVEFRLRWCGRGGLDDRQ